MALKKVWNSSKDAEVHYQISLRSCIRDDDVCFESTTGVKQGCTMAPFLFSICFQAANEALIASFPDLTSLVFKTEKDLIFTGSKVMPSATQIVFSLDKSLGKTCCQGKSFPW